jgi:hypothetical protein
MASCECGSQVQYSFHRLGCQDCGGGLCPRCAVALESASYCRSCARELLGTSVELNDPYEFRG